jgi:glycosyltransferase involved in cell wall biosynthesis
MTSRFSGRLALQQRVLPNYRVPFFDMLAQACDGGLSVFAGWPRRDEGIASGETRVAKHTEAHNLHFLSGPYYVCEQRGLTHWLADWNPDALIVEANPRYLSTTRGVRWMHTRGRKVLGWGLGAPPISGPLKGIRQKRRFEFLRQFEALIAYSRRGAAEYAALGVPPEEIFVATNAVAPRPDHAPKSRSPAAGRPSILFVGRLQARKHIDFLLRACAEMPEPRPRLAIVGDGPERRALESLARQVYPSAEFIGARHGDELNPFYAAADLFVLPGTGGLAVQEAMAHGLPVIVAKGDGTQDDLVRDGNGWQIAAEDYDALTQAMRLALSDMPRLRKMGDESYRIESEEINVEKMVEVFVGALNSLK